MRTYYHITPAANLPSILATVLDPSQTRGLKKVIWLCSKPHLDHILKKMTTRHKTPASDLAILQIRLHPQEVRRTPYPHIFTCPYPIPAQRVNLPKD